jgi:hypothetical protein
VAVDELPLPVAAGEWLVVADGAALIGVRRLEPSCLGHEAPARLERSPHGELWLTSYNYHGPAKRFWDYASLRGAFWRGNLRAGYIVEAAERSAYASAEAFLAHLQGARAGDTVGESDDSPLVRTVTYESGGDALELRYDLWHSRPAGRRVNGMEYVAPALDSPVAVQGDGGVLRAGGATLETAPQMCWLIAPPGGAGARAWIAVNPEDRPTALRLETPLGTVTAERFGAGRLAWQAAPDGSSRLVVDTLAPPGGLRVPAGVAVETAD